MHGSGDRARDSQRRQHQRDSRASARFKSASAADVNRQSVGVSAQNLGISSDPRANRIPKPSRIAFASQGNERNRPNSQDPGGSNTSQLLVPAPNPEAGATRDARGRNNGSGRPTAAPDIRANDAYPPGPRAPAARAKNNKIPGPGAAVNVAPGSPGATNATPSARGKNHKVPAPSVAPNTPGEQKVPVQGGQGNAARNLKNHPQGGRGDSSNAQGGNKNASAPA